MIFHTIRITLLALALSWISAPAQAQALCKGKPRIALSDGSKACIVDKKLTVITKTRTIVGGGPKQPKSEMSGALVVVNFLGEGNGETLNRNTARRRAKEICKAFRGEFLAKVKRPGNPFLAVVLTWGDKPQRFIIRKSESTRGPAPGGTLSPRSTMRKSKSYQEVYLTRNCAVKAQK